MIIFGLAVFLLMVLAGGMAVDFMRFEAERTRLQATLDRAVLAAASMDQELDPTVVVLDYFEKAGLGAYIGEGDVTVTESTTARRVDAEAELQLPSIFLQLADIHELRAPASGAAEEAASETEISLILDVSGSMNWSAYSGRSKLAELQTAATRFVNMVLCNPQDPTSTTNCTVESGKVSVTLIPYAEQVVVGKTLLQRLNATSEHNKSHCVTFDQGDFASTTVTAETPLKRTGHFDRWSSTGSNAYNWTCYVDTAREILALEGDPEALRNRILGLTAYGNTSIDLGMKWGAAFLDPGMQSLVSGLVRNRLVDSDFEGRPYEWDERGVEKVVVLMTDGQNTEQGYLYEHARDGLSPVYRNLELSPSGQVRAGNKYSVYNDDTDQYYWVSHRRWEDHPYGEGTYEVCRRRYSRYSGYYYDCWDQDEGEGAVQVSFVDLWAKRTWKWYEQFSWLDDQGDRLAGSSKDARLDAICDSAKAADITVFSIGFEVTDYSAGVLKQCASGDAYYYDVDANLSLTDAFASIAREIAKLKLVN